MLKTLAALALGVAVLSASGCCWPYHGGRHGGRYHGLAGDDGQEAPRPQPPRGGRGRPAPPSWGH